MPKTIAPHSRRVIPVTEGITLRREGKKGYYTAHYSLGGKHCKYRTGTSVVGEARRIAVQLNDEVLGGVVATVNLDVDKAVALYLTAKKTGGLAASTLVSYTTELRYFVQFCQLQGIRHPEQVTPPVLTAYAKTRSDSPTGKTGRTRTRPEATAHKAKLYVKNLTRFLKLETVLRADPLADVSSKKPRNKRPLPPRMRDALGIVLSAPKLNRNYMAVLMYAALRIGELQRLTPADIDLKEGFLNVNSTPGASTKTGGSRRVPIHADLHPYLKDALERARRSPLLFARNPDALPADRQPLNESTVLTLVKRLATELGLPAGQARGGWTTHVFRHAFESYALNQGVPQRAVDVWMGHAGDGSMSRTYYHLDEENSVRLMAQLKFPAPAEVAEDTGTPASDVSLTQPSPHDAVETASSSSPSTNE